MVVGRVLARSCISLISSNVTTAPSAASRVPLPTKSHLRPSALDQHRLLPSSSPTIRSSGLDPQQAGARPILMLPHPRYHLKYQPCLTRHHASSSCTPTNQETVLSSSTSISQETVVSSSSSSIDGVTAPSAPNGSAAQLIPLPLRPVSNFCRVCGSPMRHVAPQGDKEARSVCSACGYVDYFNPKLVVGCIVEHRGKILLCRRAIEPCRGLWTVPAGYMELCESSAQGAARETLEEANAVVEVLAPYAHWDIPAIGQAYILFRARLAPPYHYSSGTESLETALFAPEDIPFDHLAFSSVSITLRHYLEDLASGVFRIHHGVIDRQPGAAPNGPGSFTVKSHMSYRIAGEERL